MIFRQLDNFFSIGYPGSPGMPGPPGPPGLDGGGGTLHRRRYTIFTVHSQSTSVPGCPVNALKLWDGYSFLYILADRRAHGQDLGE